MKILFFSHDGKLGDAVVNTAFAAGAHRQDTAVDLHVLSSGAALEFWTQHALVRKVWKFQNPPLAECLATSLAIRRERFDYVVTFKDRFRSEKTRLLLFLARPVQGTITTDPAVKANTVHAVDKSRFALQAIYGTGASHTLLRYSMQGMHVPPSAIPAYANMPFILVNLFGAEPDHARSLLTEEAATLLQALHAALPAAQLLISCTAQTQDLAMQAGSRSAVPYRLANTGGNLQELFALCEHAALVVTPDTSLVHVASAFDTPVVGIYANDGIKPVVWAPTSARSAIILSDNARTIRGFSVDQVVTQASVLVQGRF